MKNKYEIIAEIMSEIDSATKKYPRWPDDPLHALAILGEEFGELTKDTLQMSYEPDKTNLTKMRTEAVQTAAMAIRFLMSFDRYVHAVGIQHDQNESVDQNTKHPHRC